MAQTHPTSRDGLPPPGPPTPSRKVLDPNRVHGSQQPPNLRDAFSDFYPNGLPNFYKMLQTPGAQGVPQTYLEDYLPVGFYKNPPPEAGAIFSTENGARPFRRMEQLMPQRRIHLWNKDEIQSVCNSLRRLYWDHMKSMQKPYCWDDLWSYFDTFDLYNYGAMNLWNVVNHLFDENKMIAMDVKKVAAIEAGHWADQWLFHELNCQKLQQWDETKGPIVSLLTQDDWQSIGNIDAPDMSLVESALKHRRSLLLSPEKLKPDANTKPNHLMKSCEEDSLENWLAGQRIFGLSGLPHPPGSTSHHASPTCRNASAPIFVQNGKHYYQPSPGQHAPSAVEALHQSAAAAAGPVCHGNNKTPLPGQTEMSSSVGRETLQVSPATRCKSTEPSYTVPSPPQDNEENGQTISNPPISGKKMSFEKRGDPKDFDAQTPTKSGRRGRGNPRANQGARKSTVTASLPTSAVMEFSTLAISEKKDNAQATSSPSKEDPSSRNSKQRDTESRTDVCKDFNTSQRPKQSSACSIPYEQKSIQQPFSDASNFNRSQRPDPSLHSNLGPGVYAGTAMLSGQTHNPLGITFHPAGTFNHVAQGGNPIPQENTGASNGLGYRHVSMQQPSLHAKGFAANRNRNPSNSSRLDRYESNDNRWYQNTENFNNANSSFGRGGYQRGGRKGAGRRGGHNQRNVTAPFTQPHAYSDSVQKMRDGGSWKAKWRREGSEPIQVTCQNVQDGITLKDYVPCSCQICEARNRSVFVAAEAYHEISTMDMQSRIRFGLSERFGFVEGVFPVTSKEPGRFVVRFANPSSVSEALTMGGGNMPEHALSIIISPATRSKWMPPQQAPTRVALGQATEQQSSVPFASYLFGSVVPSSAQGVPTSHHVPPGMLHPSVANPANTQIWSKSGGQQAYSAFTQSHLLDGPSVASQPTMSLSHFAPGTRGCFPNQTSASPHLECVGQPPDEPLQTKPPAEEALEDIHQNGRHNSYSTKSDGNGNAGIKARVSLPNTPSKASPSTEEPHTAQPAAAEKNTDIRASEEAMVCPLDNAASEPASSTVSHHRVPSAFTENEIKERRQAWAKIPMPLNPHRSRNFTPTKPSRDAIKDDVNLRVSRGNKCEAYVAESEMSTPTQYVTFTPDTGSVYERSPEKPESPLHAKKDLFALSSTGSTRQETMADESLDQHHAASHVSNESFPIDKTGCQSTPDQTIFHNPIAQDTPLQGLDTNQRTGNAQGTQTKGKGKGPKPKSKKKKSKHKMMSQGNESNSQYLQQIRNSSTPIAYATSQPLRNDFEGVHIDPLFTAVSNIPPFEPLSPAKRCHEDPEQRSTPSSSKRSKKHGNAQEVVLQAELSTLDESDSPNEDARGRKGFRMGRGGSLRMGKTRRPRAIMTGSALTEQPADTQTSPPSSDFAFQCQNISSSTDSLSLHGPDNSATSRLNPKAQEFVSPSRATLADRRIPFGSNENKTFRGPTSDDTTNRTQKGDQAIQESSTLGIDWAGATPVHDSMHSSTATTVPKHRRALSEAVQKENPVNDKVVVRQDQSKTPGKGPKRSKGKERAATLGARKEKTGNVEDATQDSPQTPKQPGTKTRKPGLINDDWPSLPASRDRALSKPQTPPIWGVKTKINGDVELGSPVTEG
ncbi:hypothetical protein FLONG3_8601 [Fusarium longipes]|uniref:RRM domain-containing protein n=1 Tax=Fusarium longipes TaxID=694270 RepID=A0A395S469_9HYPO|nr:hypothetical protein FLONG3_8601 [Fusarium longipes]